MEQISKRLENYTGPDFMQIRYPEFGRRYWSPRVRIRMVRAIVVAEGFPTTPRNLEIARKWAGYVHPEGRTILTPYGREAREALRRFLTAATR